MSIWPQANLDISQLRISPYNGWWAGYFKGYQKSDGIWAEGIFLYDATNNIPIARFDGSWSYAWSKDGKQFLFINNFNVFIFHCATKTLTQITENNLYSAAIWSVDGSMLFTRKTRYADDTDTLGGIVAMNPDGSNKRNVTNYFLSPKMLDSTRLMCVIIDTIFIFDTRNGNRSKIFKPEMDTNHNPDLYDVSLNNEFIIFQTTKKGSIPNPWNNGIWLMDTETWTARKIRGAQYWNKQYYPTWASESTFYASVYCRNDSSSMVWEFDLNGNPIRQITTKDMNVWKE